MGRITGRSVNQPEPGAPAPPARPSGRSSAHRDRRSRPRRWADAVDLDALDIEVRLRPGDRLDTVEEAFGKVDQRLETLERVILPSPADD